MHEKRNFILVLLLVGSLVWATIAWLFVEPAHSWAWSQRITSVLLALACGAWLFYSMVYEDKLPDYLRQVVGPYYYEADGICFMPMIRVRDGRAELCVYYQNRYENPVDAIVHLRPPPPGESFIIQPGMRDVHFAFRADGGDFGVIHQPIAVPRHLQGQVIDVQMAAVSWYPRSHGACLRRKAVGRPCGTLLVDWVGNALKIGVHEVSGEIALQNPVLLRLPMPDCVKQDLARADIWRQERLAVNELAMA